jgi:uncharacterized glyoxalase superfamily protein PhnB
MPQTITPYLLYQDAGAALEWLTKAFGFRETARMADENGSVGHAEMDVGNGAIVYLGSPDGYRNPRSLGTRTALVYLYVDDLDAHHARARAEGAEIVEEPADQPYGDRRYAAADPEGQHWYFAQRLGED